MGKQFSSIEPAHREFKGEAALDDYRRRKNTSSIDGFPTGLFEESIST